jgi:heme oxygenase
VAGPALEQRVKTPVLERDLASLGMAPRPPEPRTPAPDLPRLRTPARARATFEAIEEWLLR